MMNHEKYDELLQSILATVAVIGLVFVMVLTIILLAKDAFAHPIDMDAIATIESSNNPKAFNEQSGARGLYQITPLCLKHYNQAVDEKPIIPKRHWNCNKSGEYCVYSYTGIGEKPGYSENYTKDDLFELGINKAIANWYFGWLYDRTWTIKDTLIAYNWGIGNWRKWKSTHIHSTHPPSLYSGRNEKSNRTSLPEETQTYLERYELLTGTKL